MLPSTRAQRAFTLASLQTLENDSPLNINNRMHVAEMRMFRWMCGVTSMEKVKNDYNRGSLKVKPEDESWEATGFLGMDMWRVER